MINIFFYIITLNLNIYEFISLSLLSLRVHVSMIYKKCDPFENTLILECYLQPIEQIFVSVIFPLFATAILIIMVP